MESLALKYRPRSFVDLVGQRAVSLILRQMVLSDRVPHALLFRGCRGTGKTTTARILAAALNCAAPADAPCGTCPSCIATFDGSSMDVIEIDAASNGVVDDIREMRQQVLYTGGTGRRRVVIYDEAQSISPAGFNALLKILEEPPPNTVFLLLTTEAHKIPDTIASRCMPFDFRRLAPSDIADRLALVAQAEGILTEESLLRLIAEEADGAMRDALMRLEQIAAVNMSSVEQYQRLIGYVDPAPAILTPLVNGDLLTALTNAEVCMARIADARTVIKSLAEAVRDALVLRLGGEIAKSGPALAARQSLALALDKDQLVAAVLRLGRVSPAGSDANQVLDMNIVLLHELFGKDRAPNTAAPRRLTFQEMTNR